MLKKQPLQVRDVDISIWWILNATRAKSYHDQNFFFITKAHFCLNNKGAIRTKLRVVYLNYCDLDLLVL